MNPDLEGKCPRCGHPLDADVSEGLCHRCVAQMIDLGEDLEDGTEKPQNDTDNQGAPPAKEEGGKPPSGSNSAPPMEKPGDRIGRYKLLEKLGEGGMGIVWVAEQTESLHRKVALKIVKPGMDSREIVARFEAERQALALMDHPNIAKVLDAGTAPTGRPYFVMELVKGVPIMRFCDEQRLSVRERLELFTTACHAVQHAHHKGIIHRDIKPSNVMVGLYDGKPVVKVIDFGIAKAMGQPLTERTLHTKLSELLGTLTHMAPEQAKLDFSDVDTRSDIYSLGVLLYELLTGSTPLTQEELRRAALDEVVRRIREEEPPKPSARLSELGEQLATVAVRRQIEPAKLLRMVKGDLDWIVMMALEKDRERRYKTADQFATDIQNHLQHQPVIAGPPTVWYRLKKGVRRHRVAVAAGTSLVATLAIGLLVALNLLDQTRIAYAVMEIFREPYAAHVIRDLDDFWKSTTLSLRISSSETTALYLVGKSRSEIKESFPPITLTRPSDPACLHLTLGFNVDDDPAGEAKTLAPLIKYLERTLPRLLQDRPVKISLRFYRSHEESRHAQVNGQVHFFRTGVLNFLQAQQRDQRIQAPLELADPGKMAVFFTRTNSGIHGAADIAGKRIAVGDTNSTITLLALNFLGTNGIFGTNVAFYAYLDSYAAYGKSPSLGMNEERLDSFVLVMRAVLSNRIDVGVARLDKVRKLKELAPIPGTEFECSRNVWLATGSADPVVVKAFCQAMLSVPPYAWRENEYRRVAPETHMSERVAIKNVARWFPIQNGTNLTVEASTNVIRSQPNP